MALRMSDAEYDDMPGLMDVIFESYGNPLNPFVDLMCGGLHTGSPHFGTDPAQYDRETTKREAGERLLSMWKSNPRERWMKVVDPENQKIVSVTKWVFNDSDMFPNGPPDVQVDWFPPGSRMREYLAFLLHQRMTIEATRCRGTHIWLDICGTLPAYRRHGAAALMMAWAVAQADAMDCVSLIEASPQGALLYARFGFVAADHVEIMRAGVTADDAEWRTLAAHWPLEYTWMWRGKQGKNGTTPPWEQNE